MYDLTLNDLKSWSDPVVKGTNSIYKERTKCQVESWVSQRISESVLGSALLSHSFLQITSELNDLFTQTYRMAGLGM